MLHYLRDSFLFWMIDVLVVSILICLNIYSDYKVQGLITLVLFFIFYMLGRCLFMKDWKEDIIVDASASIILFIVMCIVGIVIVFVLDKCNLTTNIVRNIVDYKIITKPALNLTGGGLVAVLGLMCGKNINQIVGEEPEWIKEDEIRRRKREMQ